MLSSNQWMVIIGEKLGMVNYIRSLGYKKWGFHDMGSSIPNGIHWDIHDFLGDMANMDLMGYGFSNFQWICLFMFISITEIYKWKSINYWIYIYSKNDGYMKFI